MRGNSMKEGIKPLQILFNGEIMKVIEKLKEDSGVKSRADVIRDAIELYDKLEAFSNGKPIIIKLEDSSKEKMLILPRKMSMQ